MITLNFKLCKPIKRIVLPSYSNLYWPIQVCKPSLVQLQNDDISILSWTVSFQLKKKLIQNIDSIHSLIQNYFKSRVTVSHLTHGSLTLRNPPWRVKWAFKQRDFKKTTNMTSLSERHCYIRNDESIMIKNAGGVLLQFTQRKIVYLYVNVCYWHQISQEMPSEVEWPKYTQAIHIHTDTQTNTRTHIHTVVVSSHLFFNLGNWSNGSLKMNSKKRGIWRLQKNVISFCLYRKFSP